jgi:hypothetical protein
MQESHNRVGLLRRILITHLNGPLFYLAFVASCFPYVVFFPGAASDLQPAALVFAIVFISLSRRIPPREKLSGMVWIEAVILAISAAYAFLKFAIDPNFTIRSFAYFLSPLVFYLMGVRSTQERLLNQRQLFYIALIWLAVGCAQKFAMPTFGYELLRAPRTTAERGVTSLAAEPSFYAIQMLLLMLLNWIEPFRQLNNKTDSKNFQIYFFTEILLILQIVLLSQSFLGILLLLLFLFFRAISRFPILTLVTLIPTILIIRGFQPELADFFYQFRANGRAINIVWKLLSAPEKLLMFDQSMGERLSDIVLSIHSYQLDPYLNIGANTDEWSNFTKSTLKDFRFLQFSSGGSRVMSGIGTALYELGTVGLILSGGFLMPMLRAKRKAVIASLTLIACLLNATQLAIPMVGIILGVLIGSKTRSNQL